MFNSEISTLVKKAHKHKLLVPMINQLQKRNSITLPLTTQNESKKESRRQTVTLDPIPKNKTSELYTGRSSSKLSSSLLIIKPGRRNTYSPQKLMKILSISQENPQKLAEVIEEISKIDVEIKSLKPKKIQIRNIRINKQQFMKYLNRYFPNLLCEQILRSFKCPAMLSFAQYKQWISKIENLDLTQILRVCFQIYDLNNQGEITTHDLIELLRENDNQGIEQDILHMVKQTKSQINNQINNDVVNAFTLPHSVLRVKLDQSVMLQQQRRQSLISNDGRQRNMSKIKRQSIDFNVDKDEEQPKNNSKKKLLLITQMNNDQQNNCLFDIKQKVERKNKRSRTFKDEIKISIDMNAFISIWYPTKPHIFLEIVKNLTQLI